MHIRIYLLLCLLFCFNIPCYSQVDPDTAVLTENEFAAYNALIAERQVLETKLDVLRQKFAAVDRDPERLMATANAEVLEFSDLFFDYKVDRLVFGTNLTYRLCMEVINQQNYQGQIVGDIEKIHRSFLSNLAAITRLSTLDKTTKNYQDIKKLSAAVFDSINPAHRDLIDASRKLIQELKPRQQSELQRRLWVALNNVADIFGKTYKAFSYAGVTTYLRMGLPIFSPTKNFLGLKFWWQGYKSPNEIHEGLTRELEPGQVNMIIAPHGSAQEVAYTAARIARSLPRGRKAAIVLAAYHFVENSPRGLALANAINQHPDFIVVLAETSPFKDQVKTDQIDAKIQAAMDKGYTDIILFTEGRNTSKGGGFTPANLNTFRLLRLLPRQKVTVTIDGAQVVKRIEPVVTMLSATFPNLQNGIGVSTDPIYLGFEHAFSAEATAALAQEPAGFAALFDTVWNLKATELNPHRLGGTATEQELLRDVNDAYYGASQACSNADDYLYPPLLPLM